jgi:capsular polysaccharide transport system permease protein
MYVIATLREHARIIWALMLRELATRYGRDNIGFLWVVFEPLVFCIAVLIVFRAIRGPYERDLSLLPFLLTGYMPTILVRHIVMYSLNSVKINNALLYHKSISVLDLFSARIILEFIGVTLALIIAYLVLLIFGLVTLPANVGLLYEAWIITGFVGSGLALVVGAVSELVEVVERIVGVTLYILVPVSGTFFLADWLPTDVRRIALLLPFLNCSEMMRSGYFGSTVTTHFNAAYTITIAALMALVGLLIMRHVRQRVEVY